MMKENFENLGFEIDGILHLTGNQALISEKTMLKTLIA